MREREREREREEREGVRERPVPSSIVSQVSTV